MKIVVLDGYTENPGDLSWDQLSSMGELKVYDPTSYVEAPIIAERIGDAEVIVTNKTPISKETMDKCPNLKMIAVLATGYNVINYDYAKEKGIPVCNVPTYGTACVGQYAIALLLEVCHHIGHHDKTVHEGKWANHIDWCYWDHSLIELDGKTAGIIGFGRIGQTTGRIAKALGMKVLAYDLYPNDSGKAIAEYVDLDTLLAQSDVVFLHCNLTADNEKMINKASIAKMKDGAILINNSRGQLIDEQDVTDALKAGKLAAAGLDVVYTEPIRADKPRRAGGGPRRGARQRRGGPGVHPERAGRAVRRAGGGRGAGRHEARAEKPALRRGRYAPGPGGLVFCRAHARRGQGAGAGGRRGGRRDGGRRAPRAVALQAFGMLHFDEGGGRRCMIPLCRRCAEPRRLKARCWKTA